MKIRNSLLAFVLSTAALGSAQATVIGTAVDTNGNPISAGGSPIDFYIPLSGSASGIYGTGSVGMTPDTCSTSLLASNRCGGGWLGMFLEFSPVQAGLNTLTLAFSDLDLAGVNDPWYFYESLAVYTPPDLHFVFSAANPLVTFSDHDDQTLTIDVTIADATNPFYVGLLFGSRITASGTFTNTHETLFATLDAVSVPEPATLSLLGAGLIGLGLAARRRRRPSAS